VPCTPFKRSPSSFISLTSVLSAITWNQRSRGLAPSSAPSAFSTPKNLKRGLARLCNRSPASGAPHNSPQRGASLLQDGSALMMMEADMVSAGMALTCLAPHLLLPRVVHDAEGMCGDSDEELACLLGQESAEDWQGDGRHNPIALQLQANELLRMHAQRPPHAVPVQPSHL
jgi:hypothetical protein